MNSLHDHHPRDPKEARVEKRERLRLLCAADRTRLRLLWRLPASMAKHEHETNHNHAWVGAIAGPALTALLPFVPGKIGRWGRHVRAGMGLFRAVTRAAF